MWPVFSLSLELQVGGYDIPPEKSPLFKRPLTDTEFMPDLVGMSDQS
jgi:hypothetical protein